MIIPSGLYTALVVPFGDDGSIQWDDFANIINRQIQAKVDGLVFLGTTGESPTITSAEQEQILKTAVEIAKGKTFIIAGAGSNCTKTAIAKTQMAERIGVDAILQVNPYYNKPTQKGLRQHFEAIANATGLPIMLYNIMGRCGVNLETPTLLELAKHPQISAVKEASGDLDQIREVCQQVPKDFGVFSGDDNITTQVVGWGGHGVVSVLSNLLPQTMKALVTASLNQDHEQAAKLQSQLEPLFSACFIEANPQPIKTLMAKENQLSENFRLPITTMEPKNREKLFEIWERQRSLFAEFEA